MFEKKSMEEGARRKHLVKSGDTIIGETFMQYLTEKFYSKFSIEEICNSLSSLSSYTVSKRNINIAGDRKEHIHLECNVDRIYAHERVGTTSVILEFNFKSENVPKKTLLIQA